MSADLTIAGVKVSETALELDPGLDFDAWTDVGESLGRIARANQWWIGDWLNYGERAYGDKYTEALEVTGLAYDTLAKCKQVAAAVEIRRRRLILSWSHHREVVKLPPAEQDEWLDVAEGNGDGPMPTKQFREALRAANVRETLPTSGKRATAHAAKVIENLVGRLSNTHLILQQTDVNAALSALDPQEANKWTQQLRSLRTDLTRLISALETVK